MHPVECIPQYDPPELARLTFFAPSLCRRPSLSWKGCPSATHCRCTSRWKPASERHSGSTSSCARHATTAVRSRPVDSDGGEGRGRGGVRYTGGLFSQPLTISTHAILQQSSGWICVDCIPNSGIRGHPTNIALVNRPHGCWDFDLQRSRPRPVRRPLLHLPMPGADH